METYTRKEIIEILDIDGISGLNYNEGDIQTTKDDIELFRSELDEAFNMTLEEYSPKAYRIYKFLFLS